MKAGWLGVPRLVWICVAVGLIGAAALLLQYGVSLWALLGALFLIACPAAVVWVLIVQHRFAAPNFWSRK
jgi:hypothetical protein